MYEWGLIKKIFFGDFWGFFFGMGGGGEGILLYSLRVKVDIAFII